MTVKPEGGHRRGHSQMEHWVPTAEVKDDARQARRAADRDLVAEGEADVVFLDALYGPGAWS